MKLLKSTLLLVAMVLGISALPARAQDSGSFTMASNNVPILFTNTAPSATVFTLSPLYRGYWVFPSAASGSTTNSASEPITFTFGVSDDGTTYTTNRAVFQNQLNPAVTNSLYVSLLPNALTQQKTRAFIDMSGAKFLKMLTAENPAGGQATNYWTNITCSVVAGGSPR